MYTMFAGTLLYRMLSPFSCGRECDTVFACNYLVEYAAMGCLSFAAIFSPLAHLPSFLGYYLVLEVATILQSTAAEQRCRFWLCLHAG